MYKTFVLSHICITDNVFLVVSLKFIYKMFMCMYAFMCNEAFLYFKPMLKYWCTYIYLFYTKRVNKSLQLSQIISRLKKFYG